MGNIQQWPEKLRHLIEKSGRAQVVFGVLLFVVPEVLKAITNALVAWICPKPEEVSAWLYFPIAIFIGGSYAIIVSMAIKALFNVPKKDNASRDS